MTASSLPVVVARLVDVLSEASVRSLRCEVSAFAEPSSACLTAMHRAVQGAKAPGLVAALHHEWSRRLEVEGQDVALLLDTALETAARVGRRRTAVEIVWTGPVADAGAVPVRLTREVFIEVAQAARERLVVVSFAAFKDPLISAELQAAAGRHVDVRIVLESPKRAGGASGGDPQQALAALGRDVSFYIWPADRRPALPTGVAAMHAKTVIADEHTALVSSANLTGHALTQNMELGVKLVGGSAPRELSAHFLALMRSGILKRVTA